MKYVYGLVLAVLLAWLAGCSTYSVHYEETQEDGSYITVRIMESIPPGGKRVSQGSANVGVDAEGTWHLDIGAEADTDALGTAALLERLMDKMFEAGREVGRSEAGAP